MEFLRRRRENKNAESIKKEVPAHLAESAGRAAMRAALEREISPEQVDATLEQFRQSIDPLVNELKQNSPDEKLALSNEKDFVHLVDWGERFIVRDGFAPDKEQYRPAEHTGPLEAPDVPRGRKVTVMGHNDPSLPAVGNNDRGLGITGSVDLAFMEDGQVLYHAHANDPHDAHWADIHKLPPNEALFLVETMAAGLEHHRTNP
jgi:hypothetical protein